MKSSLLRHQIIFISDIQNIDPSANAANSNNNKITNNNNVNDDDGDKDNYTDY